MRIVNPIAVISWFRPPIDHHLEANDLEIYTTRTDALTLLTLSLILLILSDALPLPNALVGSTLTRPASERTKRPYAKAVVILTIFHHVGTAVGSFSHWRRPGYATLAMGIGVWGNVLLSGLGVLVLVLGFDESGKKGRGATRKVKT